MLITDVVELKLGCQGVGGGSRHVHIARKGWGKEARKMAGQQPSNSFSFQRSAADTVRPH